MHRTRPCIIFCLLFLIPILLGAREHSLYFDRLTTENGLSNNKVNCILQDRRGFIWIGTDDGLNRFDGHHFITFQNQPGNPSTISGNLITDLLEDAQGVIWIATADGGLSRYDYRLPPKHQFRQYRHNPVDSTSIPGNFINALSEDQRGYLWLATSGYSVLRFNKEDEIFERPVLTGTRTALDMTQDKDGILWVGRQGGGILKVNTASLDYSVDERYLNLYAKLPHATVTSLYNDRQKHIWFGSWDKVLYRYDPFTGQEYAYPASSESGSFPGAEVLCFNEDVGGRLWMGTRSTGLVIFDRNNGQFTNYRHDPSREGTIADNQVNCVYIDKKGRAWLGTNRGISISNPEIQQFNQQFLNFPSRRGADLIIYDFIKNPSGSIYIGTSDGMFIRRRGETELGVWEKYNVRLIGVDVAAIETAEDREKFRQLMIKIDMPVAPSRVANSLLEGKEFAQEIGFPLVIRPSFTLGGTGGGFVHGKEDLEQALDRGLKASPVHEVLVEKAVLGWKEYELELLRDKNDNVVIICTVENVDPMGVHTGDSITVAPAMTLSDTAFQEMRNKAILMMRSLGNFAGGCNVQFALDPNTEQLIAVEINPRVSRSSALASKATGYPIAKIAAKLAIGFTLDELKNQITKTTSAYFEPALDYVIVKMPRWNFDKFKGANDTLGLQMKSVGEVMAIGRSFAEAVQKATQSLENNAVGLGNYSKNQMRAEELLEYIKTPKWDRIFRIKDALMLGVSVGTISKTTGIDRWFINEIQKIVDVEKRIAKHKFDTLPMDLLREAKFLGFSDQQISLIMQDASDEAIYERRKQEKLTRVFKMVDTCSAEFEAKTPYFYSTFESGNDSESKVSDRKKVIVLGSGPNRIGQGIEFDYCCVHGLLALKECGYEAIMVNCNPETVSTDFDMADKLYFEPVFWEHLWEIIEHEKPYGVIVQLGGQTALKLAERLNEKGIRIIGTSYDNMDIAEDRGRFSDMLKELNIPYPAYGTAYTVDEAVEVANKVGYPVLVRPSYVLGGQRMRIVINDEEVEKAVISLLKHIPGNKILIDHFLDRCQEAEIDAICDGDDFHVMGVMEHIEPAGIHSGDSNAVLPAFNLTPLVVETMEEYARKIAFRLNIKGLINIQFAIKDGKVYVIEANPRASRTTPFIAKAYQIPYLNVATRVMLGENKLKDFKFVKRLKGYAIKEPVFSFEKFPGVSKELGPEMKSTGEAIRFIKDLRDPYFRQLYKDRSMYLSK